MAATKINLPSKLTEDTWFYKLHTEELKPHLGKFYVSYSTASSYNDYLGDFIKSKLVGIPNKGSVYTSLGSYLGEAVETGKFSDDNPEGFEGQENIDFDELRPEGAEYEKLVVIDYGEWIFIGFIDRYLMTPEGAHITDFKTGAANKVKTYSDKDYTQVILYAHARELAGDKIKDTDVYFITREGSHIKPPLRLTDKQHYIDLEYSKERVDFAVKKLKKSVDGISELYTFYLKYFG